MSEPATCALCGNDETTSLFNTSDRLLDLPGSYCYMRCANCGLTFLHPRPSWAEREAHYSESYRGYERLANQASRLQRFSMAYGLHKRQAILDRYTGGGHLLDVGCSGGDFIYQVSRTPSWQSFGLERVASMAAAARRDYGLPVMVGDLAQAGLASGSFDAITLWTVLEHMQDPKRGLSECARLLRPEGILLIRTVTADGWGAAIFGSYWVGYDAPRVLFVLTRATLSSILERAGFAILNVGYQFHDYHPYVWSWKNWCSARIRPRMPRAIAMAIAASWPARILTAPFFALQTALGGNGYITIVARSGPARTKAG